MLYCASFINSSPGQPCFTSLCFQTGQGTELPNRQAVVEANQPVELQAITSSNIGSTVGSIARKPADPALITASTVTSKLQAQQWSLSSRFQSPALSQCLATASSKTELRERSSLIQFRHHRLLTIGKIEAQVTCSPRMTVAVAAATSPKFAW